MYKRVGYFFIVASVIMLFIFGASYQVDEPDYALLFWGLVTIFVGIVMVIRNRRPSEKAERFRIIQKMRSRKK